MGYDLNWVIDDRLFLIQGIVLKLTSNSLKAVVSDKVVKAEAWKA